MNKFYKIPKLLQWIIAIIFFILVFALMLWWLNLCKINILFYFLIFVFVPISQFLATPFLSLIGVYHYLSPMLMVFMPSQKKYDIHNGTSFDYLFLMTNTKAGTEWRNKILQYFLKGLMVIIERIESGKLSEDIVIRGSSYFFSERTAKRLGFEIQRAGIFEKINIIINFLDLMWMYSIAFGKLKIPNVFRMKSAKIKGKELLLKKAEIENLYHYLKNKNPKSKT